MGPLQDKNDYIGSYRAQMITTIFQKKFKLNTFDVKHIVSL